MKKFGATGMKWLKIIHLVFVVLWTGGAISMMALAFGVSLKALNEVQIAYAAMKIMDDMIVRNGALGCLVTGLVYGIGTNWGFFKQRWIGVKWSLFFGQLLFAILFLNHWLEANLAILKTEPDTALYNPVFFRNHLSNQIGMGVQIALFIVVIGISVLKPWKKKTATE